MSEHRLDLESVRAVLAGTADVTSVLGDGASIDDDELSTLRAMFLGDARAAPVSATGVAAAAAHAVDGAIPLADRRHPAKPSALRTAYRRAAAVLAGFDIATLRPCELCAPDGSAATELADDVIPDYGSDGDGTMWMLQPMLRSDVLCQLSETNEFLKALAANPDRPRTRQQRIFEDILLGRARPLGGQSIDELFCTLQAVRWLAPTALASELPDPTVIGDLIEQKRLTAEFEALTVNFTGRTRELQMLRDYVGVLEPSTQLEAVRRRVRDHFDLRRKPPLSIHAEGGAGKSALVARFLLDHSKSGLPGFRYVYLDFDSPVLVATRPATIMQEMARQLSVRYPEHRGRLQHFIAQLGAQHAEEGYEHVQSTKMHGLDDDREAAYFQQETDDAQASFAELLRDLVTDSDEFGEFSVPLLVVVDTYEEVQLSGVEHETQLWRFLGTLAEQFPTLRIVVFGRALLDKIPVPMPGQVRSRALKGLAQAPAIELLHTEKVSDPAIARSIFRQVGGNPLSLKLAAEVFRLDRRNAAGGTAAGPESWHFRRALSGEGAVQGSLYQRILWHIKDPDVRRLAHPGLVLRRITPQLIKDVLQGPCGVEVPTSERAEQLFDRLRRDVTLVTVDADGALRHRADVRRIMLRLIAADKPDEVQAIHRGAVEFYRTRPELASPAVSRAEEIYHRLQLGQSLAEIQDRWLPTVVPHLQRSIDELPVRSQAVLAALAGIRLPESILKRARLEEWERYTAHAVEEEISRGRYEAALEQLRTRKQRSPASPLHLLEARANTLLGRRGQATQAIGRALTAAEQSGSTPRLIDTLLLTAHMALELGDADAADGRLRRAQRLASDSQDAARQLEVLVRRLQLTSGTPDRARVRGEIAALLDRLSDEKWLEHQAVVRQCVLALGFDHPELLQRMVKRIGVGRPNPAQLLRVAEFLCEIDTHTTAVRRRTAAFARTVDEPVPDRSPKSLAVLLQRLDHLDRLGQYFLQVIPIIAATESAHAAGTLVLSQLFTERLTRN